MGLEELKPGNTRRAKATAVSAFKRVLKAENVSVEYVKSAIEHNATGRCFVSVMDKFGMYLAFNEGKSWKPLAPNSTAQYYRQTKVWLLDQFPQHRVSLEARLLEMGKTLERFCAKREGGFVKKVPPCRKDDLKRMMVYLYSTACSSSDYQGAALLCILWYLFGRASDLTLVRKQNVSVDAANVFFVRFMRMKTSEEQGLSFFPDDDFVTCPLLAVALALVMQNAPSSHLVDNLPEISVQAAATLAPDLPLLELLDHPIEGTGIKDPVNSGVASTPQIYAHVNRILDRITRSAEVDAGLTSHSFRRGGVQHANGCSDLTEFWIFDRGTWSMSLTNEGFNYVFNTSSEDHKVCTVLAGYQATTAVPPLDLRSFDEQTLDRIAAVQRALFVGCRQLAATQCNVNQRVIDVLTAYLIRHYPLLKELSPAEPGIKRLETCALHAGCPLAELFSWSAHLVMLGSTCDKKKSTASDTPSDTPSKLTEEHRIIRHQAAVIDHLIDHSKNQDARVDALEAKLNRDPPSTIQKRKAQETTDDIQPKKRKKKTSVTYLRAKWFAWYAHEPRLWAAQVPKQTKSDAKLLVAFMKLFLEDGFSLDVQAADYRDQVRTLGIRSEEAVLAFLSKRAMTSKGVNAVLKSLRVLHRSGAPNARIERHQRLLQTAAIKDPAPGYTQDVLEIIG